MDGRTSEELKEIFKGSKDAMSIMKKVYAEHADMETVIVNPDSWAGRELLSQSSRMIELNRKISQVECSIIQLGPVRKPI